jgi:aerobic carbon-monoxide dehydrogenase large subunit
MDYAMPSAGDMPSFVSSYHPAPATTNPLGVNGCGEVGCANAMVAVPHAIIDAISSR